MSDVPELSVHGSMGGSCRPSDGSARDRAEEGLLLTVTGNTTHRTYTFPVQYAREDEALWVFVGDQEHKRWWRNLMGGAPVTVWVDGNEHAAKATVIRGADEPEEARRALGVYGEAFPSVAKRYPDPSEAVFVRIEET